MYLKNCTEKHLPEILAIFNEAIANSTALYDYEPRTAEKIRAWYEERVAKQIAVIGAFDDDGALLGFATYGSFRPHDGYRFTAEHSVYVRADKRGNGLGKTLLAELIAEVQRNGNVHSLVAVIDTENAASVALHEKLGFTFCGQISQCGFKFGRWLDIVFYQMIF